MAGFNIAALKDGIDAAGNNVVRIFTVNDPDYAIYATRLRVMIQYADDPGTAGKQRTTLAPLGVMRSEINGLIDGWRKSRRHNDIARVSLFDLRTADALVMALEGDVAGAYLAMDAVRLEIIDRRTSVARFEYMGVALAFGALVFAVLGIAALVAGTGLCGHDPASWRNLAEGIAGGTLGAFFSIASGLTNRSILTDLQPLDNGCDAVLRMMVGVISAAVLVCLLHAGVGISLARAGVTTVLWMQIFVIGFLAGFSERMVPDLLAKAAASIESSPLPPRPGPQAAAADKPLTGKSPVAERIGGESPAPVAPDPANGTPDDQAGDCACDRPADPADATADHALPPASGGVEGER